MLNRTQLNSENLKQSLPYISFLKSFIAQKQNFLSLAGTSALVE